MIMIGYYLGEKVYEMRTIGVRSFFRFKDTKMSFLIVLLSAVFIIFKIVKYAIIDTNELQGKIFYSSFIISNSISVEYIKNHSQTVIRPWVGLIVILPILFFGRDSLKIFLLWLHFWHGFRYSNFFLIFKAWLFLRKRSVVVQREFT